jgi:hypothetical protein
MLDDLIIFQKTYDLILWLFPIINRFPKKQRFVLGQQIENELIEIIKDIILANNERNKTEILKRISVRLDTLRVLVRLAKDLINIQSADVARPTSHIFTLRIFQLVNSFFNSLIFYVIIKIWQLLQKIIKVK